MNLYVHFPFCRSRCAYCALLSRAGTSSASRAAHANRIAREIAARGVAPRTLYFGGGTPALCDLEPIFAALRAQGAAPDEFTVELHPRDVTSETLKRLHAGGVNRISLGVQSFDDGALRMMGRGHSADEAAEAFRRVRDVFPNAGLDLIAGWPGTSDASWRETVARALGLAPVHVSCYSLIHEPKTRLDLSVRKGEVVLPDDDAALAQVAYARDAFAAAGLRRYEVSNYARPGFECRHNCAVWRGEDYVGLGEGAHGRVGRSRTVGTRGGYDVTTVTEPEDALERALMGLRTAEGVSLARIADAWPCLAPRLSAWRERLQALVVPGVLASPAPDRFVPTDRGFEVCDAVMAELL